MSRPVAGTIVIVDWRRDARPKEPNKRRPAVVVEDHELFPDDYPNVAVVPLTHDSGLAHATFSVQIEPDGTNGIRTLSWALAHHVTSVSFSRITPTESAVTASQLASIRRRIGLALGIC